MIKKFLAVVMTAAVAVSMAVVPASAANHSYGYGVNYSSSYGYTEGSEAWNTGGSYTSNASVANSQSLSKGSSVTGIICKHGGSKVLSASKKKTVKTYSTSDKIRVRGIRINGKNYYGKGSELRNGKDMRSTGVISASVKGFKVNVASEMTGVYNAKKKSSSCKVIANAYVSATNPSVKKLDISLILDSSNKKVKAQYIKLGTVRVQKCITKVEYKNKNAKTHSKIYKCQTSGKVIKTTNAKHSYKNKVCKYCGKRK